MHYIKVIIIHFICYSLHLRDISSSMTREYEVICYYLEVSEVTSIFLNSPIARYSLIVSYQ